MPKKAISGLILGLLGLVGSACAAPPCNPTRTGIYTTRAGIYEPAINECSWGASTNADWSIVDSSMCILAGTNNFTGANFFANNAVTFSGGTIYKNLSNNQNAGVQNLAGSGKANLTVTTTNGLWVNGNELDADFNSLGLAGDIIAGGNGDSNYGRILVIGSSGTLPVTPGNIAYSGFTATSPITTSTLWSLPPKDGTANQFLATDGNAHLSFVNAGANAILNQNSLQSNSTFYVTSGTVAGPLAVIGALTANTISGANLTACGDTSHAVSWNGGFFGCQAITGGGGGAGNNIYPATATPTFPFGLITTSSATFSGANAILSTQTLQSGATFYVSSGTVDQQFNYGFAGNYGMQIGQGSNPAGILTSYYTNASPNVSLYNSLLVTRTSVNGSPHGFVFNDSGGNWQFGIDPTQKLVTSRIPLLISSAASFTSAFPSTFTYQLVAGSITVNGPSDGNIQLTIAGSAYNVTSTSNTGSGNVTLGDAVVFTSTSGTLGDGGLLTGVPATPFHSLQYNNLGMFGGATGLLYNGSVFTDQIATNFQNVSNIQFTNVSTVTASSSLFDFTSSTMIISSETINNQLTIGTIASGSLNLLASSPINFSGTSPTPTSFIQNPSSNLSQLNFTASDGVGVNGSPNNTFATSLFYEGNGSRAPLGSLGNDSDTYSAVFSTSTAIFHVAISTSGHFITRASTGPTISSCGSNPPGSVVGDDNAGVITVGGTAPTACTLTFLKTWGIGSNVVCTITDNSTTISDDISSVTPTTLTLGFGVGGLAGGNVYYRCSCSGPNCR